MALVTYGYEMEEMLHFLTTATYSSKLSKSQKKNLRRKAKQYEYSNGKLLRYVTLNRQRLLAEVVTTEEQKNIIFVENHDSPIGGHPGETKTIQKIKEKFFWPNMYTDLRQRVQKCTTCQKHGSLPTLRKELVPIQTSKVWELVGIDFVGPLPETERGNKYIITCTDLFSKWPVAYAAPNKEATTVANKMLRIFTTFGIPKAVLSDNGSEFCNKLNDELYEQLGIERRRTAVYHPQANGQDENTNKNIKNKLRKLVNENATNWDDLLDVVLFSLRTERQTSTKVSPFEVMFGGRPPKFEEEFDGATNLVEPSTEDIQAEMLIVSKKVEEVTATIRKNINAAQDKQKRQYDQRIKKKAVQKRYRVGEKVLIVNQRKKGLKARFKGPYLISGVTVNGNVLVNDMNGKACKGSINIKNVKKFIEGDNDNSASLNATEFKGNTEAVELMNVIENEVCDDQQREDRDTQNSESDGDSVIIVDGVEDGVCDDRQREDRDTQNAESDGDSVIIVDGVEDGVCDDRQREDRDTQNAENANDSIQFVINNERKGYTTTGDNELTERNIFNIEMNQLSDSAIANYFDSKDVVDKNDQRRANEISQCCVNASTNEILAKLRAQPENNIILSMLGSKTKIRTYQLKEALEDSVGDDVVFEYLKIVATSVNDKNIKVTSPGELITDETYLPEGTQDIEELMALDLLISCNINNYHWTLTAVFPKEKMISHLNPMGEEVNALNGVLNKWNAYLERTYGLKEIWPLQTIPHAKQQDSVSCGIFCAKFAECIMRNQQIPVEFNKNEVIEFRDAIVRKLLQEGEKDETWHLKFCRLCGNLDGPKKNKGQKTDRWVRCDNCLPQRWYHVLCTNVVINEEGNNPFSCKDLANIHTLETPNATKAQVPVTLAEKAVIKFKKRTKRIKKCHGCGLEFKSEIVYPDNFCLVTMLERLIRGEKAPSGVKKMTTVHFHVRKECLLKKKLKPRVFLPDHINVTEEQKKIYKKNGICM